MKRDCDQYIEDLSALIDGELTAAWRAEVEAHVAGCADCRARVAELRQLSAGMAAMPKVQADSNFLEEVRGKIAEGETPRVEPWWVVAVRSPWVQWPVRAAATVAVLLGIAALITPTYFSYLHRTEQRQQLALARKQAEPAPVSEPATPPAAAARVNRMEEAKAPAPAAPAQVAAGARVDRPALQTDKPTAGLAKTANADKLTVGAETILVEAGNLNQVRAQAMEVAVALDGRVTDAGQLADSFRVELPARNVALFRSRLLSQNVPATSELDAAAKDKREVSGFATGGSLSNEPTSVLEIRVVPPAK